MKPHEILQTIIDNEGSCDWITNQLKHMCNDCPMGKNMSCLSYVFEKIGKVSCSAFKEAAIKLLSDMEIERIVLGSTDVK